MAMENPTATRSNAVLPGPAWLANFERSNGLPPDDLNLSRALTCYFDLVESTLYTLLDDEPEDEDNVSDEEHIARLCYHLSQDARAFMERWRDGNDVEAKHYAAARAMREAAAGEDSQATGSSDTALDRAYKLVDEIKASADLLSMVAVGKQVDSLLGSTIPTVAHKLVDQCMDLSGALDAIDSAIEEAQAAGGAN